MDFTPIIKMVLDFVSTLVPAKTGTKFLIGLGGIGAVLYMAMKEMGTTVHIYAIGGIVLIYFIADIICKLIIKGRHDEKIDVTNRPVNSSDR